jgi:hypothetical protein
VISSNKKNTINFFKTNFFGFFIVLSLSLFLIRDRIGIIFKPFYNFPDSDVEGTIWFVWSRCEYNVLNPYTFEEATKNFINYPQGLSLQGQVLDNLWYQAIVMISSLTNCNLNLILSLLNLMTIFCFAIIPIMSFIFLIKLEVSKMLALVGSLSILTISNLLLMTRTSISRNMFFISFGIILYIFYLLHTNKDLRNRNLVIIFLLSCIQTNLYQYHGFFLVIIISLFLILLRIKQLISTSNFIKLIIPILLGFIGGALSSIRSIFNIYQSRLTEMSDLRPWEYELIPTSRIFDFGVIINNFFGLRSENSNGWLSLLNMIIIFRAIYLVLSRKASINRKFRLAEILFLVSFLLTFFQYSLVTLSSIHFIYYKIFNIMRGISNLDLIVFPLLLLSSIIINGSYVPTLKKIPGPFFSKMLVLLIVLISTVQVFPGERDTLSSFVNFNLITRNTEPLTKYLDSESIVFHVPDTTYQGIPGRFNQILQVAHKAKIVNGSYLYSQDQNLGLINEQSNYFDDLKSRGVNIITVHWNLIPDSDVEFYETQLLESKNFKLVANVENEHILSEQSLPISNLQAGLSDFSIIVIK